ncbi:MAG: family 20 glycosylhydrolase, partial [bacterium]|nr:family 20 glycosylhydrolase [bacterium]
LFPDLAGAFYGVATLGQLVRQLIGRHPAGEAKPGELPCLRIEDWPDFPNRGVMLDVSRDKVPKLETLKALADRLAGWKINQMQLYVEHTFAYRNHREVWEKASPLTGEEILELDAWCRERHIELVPNQNSFGHFERWLKFDRYKPLAELPEKASTLSPVEPRAVHLLGELYAEYLPHFSSRQFNVGCDETWDLGKGRSKPAVEARGEGRVYLDFLLQIHRLVQKHGRTMQFWGDIIMHHPELIAELPEGIIALEWGYDAGHPFAEDGRKFAEAGVPFYVCPGTSSWNSICGRTKNAMDNLWSAAGNGLACGAIGFLNTDWGDWGHWQHLPVSYLGFAYGAAVSWAAEANHEIDIVRALDRHAFEDAAGVMGRVAHDLGNAYLATNVTPRNSSIPWRLFHDPARPLDSDWMAQIKADRLEAAVAEIRAALALLSQQQMARPDASLIVDEFHNNARMMLHSLRMALTRLETGGSPLPEETRRELAEELEDIITEYRRLWLARNRPGGLDDSVSRFNTLRKFYA